MTRDTLREGNENKRNVQEPKPFHKFFGVIFLSDIDIQNNRLFWRLSQQLYERNE